MREKRKAMRDQRRKERQTGPRPGVPDRVRTGPAVAPRPGGGPLGARPGGGPLGARPGQGPSKGVRKGLGAEGGDLELPGEKEFNECVKIPAGRRIKVTLKKGSDLADLVAWISSMTCKKFIVADSLRAQKVTLISPVPVTAAEAYRAFLSALEVMGLTVVPVGNYLKVVQGNWAIQSPIPTYFGTAKDQIPQTDAVVTQMIQVSNVDVNELMMVLNKLKSRSGDVTAYKPTNLLIITDAGHNVRRMVRIIRELDVEVEGEKIWVVRIKHADAEDINKILSQIFAQRALGKPIPKVKRGKGAGGDGGTDDLSGMSASKIVVDQNSNSLIIVATAPAFVKIAALIRKLDVEELEGTDQRINVYYLENANADELSSTLSGLTSGARGGAPAARRGGKGRRAGGAATPGQAASLFEGEVKISPDKATNSLVIIANSKDFLSLRKVIKKLDLPRRQVFVEAAIMEVSLDKNRKLGFGYHGGGIAGEDPQTLIFGGVQHPDVTSLTFNPLTLMGLAVGARGEQIEGSAKLLGLPTDVPAFGVMFQAIQNNNNVNVLSSPHILTTDNEPAEISVGQNIPFQGAFMGGGFGFGGSGQTGAAGAFSSFLPTVSVQRQDVALKLKITPHVNDSDMVRLELEQEVSDIASENFGGLGPSTSKRTAKTVVVVRDQQTVVIGGLMRNQVRDSVSKVPLLGDIPILGYFFKHKDKTIQKTNLLLVLTPYVIRDQSDLRRIFKKKLEERREFIERYTTFEHGDLEQDIDFRHKRGLLGEIHKVASQVEQEVKMLEEARHLTNDDPEPVDMPKGMSPSESPAEGEPSSPSVAPAAPTGGEPTAPGRRAPPEAQRTIRLDRQIE